MSRKPLVYDNIVHQLKKVLNVYSNIVHHVLFLHLLPSLFAYVVPVLAPLGDFWQVMLLAGLLAASILARKGGLLPQSQPEVHEEVEVLGSHSEKAELVSPGPSRRKEPARLLNFYLDVRLTVSRGSEPTRPPCHCLTPCN